MYSNGSLFQALDRAQWSFVIWIIHSLSHITSTRITEVVSGTVYWRHRVFNELSRLAVRRIFTGLPIGIPIWHFRTWDDWWRGRSRLWCCLIYTGCLRRKVICGHLLYCRFSGCRGYDGSFLAIFSSLHCSRCSCCLYGNELVSLHMSPLVLAYRSGCDSRHDLSCIFVTDISSVLVQSKVSVGAHAFKLPSILHRLCVFAACICRVGNVAMR